jgi:hypothetical protein
MGWTVIRLLIVRFGVIAIFLASTCLAADEPPAYTVNAVSVGPRILEDQTKAAIVRSYLDSWQTFRRALDNNDPALLDAAFVGVAKDKLAATIAEQQKLEVHTVYQDRNHIINLVFYSPEGLSVQLTDDVDYDVQLFDHGKLQTTGHIRARYIAVLTPTEVRWKVRVFQAAEK